MAARTTWDADVLVQINSGLEQRFVDTFLHKIRNLTQNHQFEDVKALSNKLFLFSSN